MDILTTIPLLVGAEVELEDVVEFEPNEEPEEEVELEEVELEEVELEEVELEELDEELELEDLDEELEELELELEEVGVGQPVPLIPSEQFRPIPQLHGVQYLP